MPRKKTAVTKLQDFKSRRRSGRHAPRQDDVPEIYQDMLVEAAALSPLPLKREGRAAKRRRLEEPPLQTETPELESTSIDTLGDDLAPSSDSVPPVRALQTTYDDLASSDESDAAFEDVDLELPLPRVDADVENEKPLQLDFSRTSGPAETPSVQRRKPVTAAEKRLRLDVHKWHLLCLILHLHHRNRWCDNEEVQTILKPLIPRKLTALLHLDESKPQYARNHGFNKAIEEISDIWQREWTITAKGMRRAFWNEDADVVRDIDDLEDPVDLSDFKQAAKTLAGSRDLGAQLFCALLRSVAVDTRLVCSLQPLPFSGIAKGTTPEKVKPQYIYASSINQSASYQASSSTENTASPSNSRWRASEFASEEQSPRLPPPLLREPLSKKSIKESPYPIFWTEVFSPSIDKWIPVDPLVRHTFNKPRTSYEPPASDRLNSMSYVVAFEDDSSARDVTRRYASQYNAKTRKLRVESTKGGERWWRRTMEFFERPFPETRDEIEDNELTAREAQEGMPKNVADFKGHPIFALERHLRRNEVIYPLREAGKIRAGSGATVEPVYRRKDVYVVRSADQWYRKGRDVKEGEQPLKRAISRRSDMNTPMDEDEVGEDGTGLYAEFQTAVYVPPPTVRGKVPRNAYGNLDVFVPSMIPAGAIHLQHPIAAHAAKVLGVDHADAVTGFNFKGRQGTAVVNGIVVAEEYREALVNVIRAMEDEQAEAEQLKQTNLALQMWRRFVTALRIRDKIDKEYADASSSGDVTEQTYDRNASEEDEMRGGFILGEGVNELDAPSSTAQSTLMRAPLSFVPSQIIVIDSPHKLESPAPEVPSQKTTHFDTFFDEANANGNGGGFLIEEIEHEEGGGFMREEDANGGGGGFFAAEDQDRGSVSEKHHGQSNTGLDAALGVRSMSETALVEEGGESVTQTLPMTAPTCEPPNVAPSPPDTVAESHGGFVLDRREEPPALVKQSSTLSVKDLGSTRSPDSIENQSLLSHDPEDEDAEPEWLVDDAEL